jgi:hypothetical protein
VDLRRSVITVRPKRQVDHACAPPDAPEHVAVARENGLLDLLELGLGRRLADDLEFVRELEDRPEGRAMLLDVGGEPDDESDPGAVLVADRGELSRVVRAVLDGKVDVARDALLLAGDRPVLGPVIAWQRAGFDDFDEVRT